MIDSRVVVKGSVAVVTMLALVLPIADAYAKDIRWLREEQVNVDREQPRRPVIRLTAGSMPMARLPVVTAWLASQSAPPLARRADSAVAARSITASTYAA